MDIPPYYFDYPHRFVADAHRRLANDALVIDAIVLTDAAMGDANQELVIGGRQVFLSDGKLAWLDQLSIARCNQVSPRKRGTATPLLYLNAAELATKAAGSCPALKKPPTIAYGFITIFMACFGPCVIVAGSSPRSQNASGPSSSGITLVKNGCMFSRCSWKMRIEGTMVF